MADPKQILAAAKRILLVDWPNESVPRTLIAAGFKVFGSSPKGYTEAIVVADHPENTDDIIVLPPKNGEVGYLVFRRLNGAPDPVDIVNVFRPAQELPGIIERLVIPLDARTLWLQPPNTSSEAATIVGATGLEFIEAVDIADVARNVNRH